MKISEMQQQAWQNSEDHGFHSGAENTNIPTKLMLIVCEAAEAMEDFRKKGADPSKMTYSEKLKPEGFPSELADILIRVGDLAGILGIDLEAAVVEKMAYNRTREYMHGKAC